MIAIIDTDPLCNFYSFNLKNLPSVKVQSRKLKLINREMTLSSESSLNEPINLPL